MQELIKLHERNFSDNILLDSDSYIFLFRSYIISNTTLKAIDDLCLLLRELVDTELCMIKLDPQPILALIEKKEYSIGLYRNFMSQTYLNCFYHFRQLELNQFIALLREICIKKLNFEQKVDNSINMLNLEVIKFKNIDENDVFATGVFFPLVQVDNPLQFFLVKFAKPSKFFLLILDILIQIN